VRVFLEVVIKDQLYMHKFLDNLISWCPQQNSGFLVIKKNRKPLTEVTSSKKRNRRKEHLEKKKRKEKETLLGNCPN